MTTVAIMQPYLFPYIGYYQLVAAADIFVFLDDVNFRKGSFINRNYVIDPSGQPVRFTLPVSQQSPNRKINEHVYADAGEKPIRTFSQCYGDDGATDRYRDIFERTVRESPGRNLAEVNANSITRVTEALGIDTEYLRSSEIDPAPAEKGESRVISLCERLGATRYINLPGGRSLYDPERFASRGIELLFLRPPAIPPKGTPSGTGVQPSFLHQLMKPDKTLPDEQLKAIELE